MKDCKTVRMVTCCNCADRFSRGSSQVYRKMLFLFCAWCWTNRRVDCHAFMQGCASSAAAKEAD